MEPTPDTAPAQELWNDDDIFCPQCSYNLHGLTSERCPECGLDIDFEGLKTSQIPWVDRRARGRLKAYLQTVQMVLFRRPKFHEEIIRPVSYLQARSFRLTTVWIVFMSVVIVSLLSYLSEYSGRFEKMTSGQFAEHGVNAAVLLGSFFLFLLAATSVPSYFFHSPHIPPQRKKRAVALSYYSCAPLSWIPLLALLCIPAHFIGSSLGGRNALGMIFLTISWSLPFLIPLSWLIALVQLAKMTLNRSTVSLASLF